MIRSLISLVIAVILIYVATTVGCGSARTETGWPYGNGGKLTFAGQVRAIWHTEEVQDLKHGIETETGPAVKKVEHEIHEHTQ